MPAWSLLPAVADHPLPPAAESSAAQSLALLGRSSIMPRPGDPSADEGAPGRRAVRDFPSYFTSSDAVMHTDT